MTTTVTVHVGGKYRATVKREGHDDIVVEGTAPDYGATRSFSIPHNETTNLTIIEHEIADEPPAA